MRDDSAASENAPPMAFKFSGAGSWPWLLAVVGSIISSMPKIIDWQLKKSSKCNRRCDSILGVSNTGIKLFYFSAILP